MDTINRSGYLNEQTASGKPVVQDAVFAELGMLSAVSEAIGALADAINGGRPLDDDSLLAARRLVLDLCAQTTRLQALIDASAKDGGPPPASPEPQSLRVPDEAGLLGRLRVIRARSSADNAVVGPVVPSNLVAQRADLEGQKGSRSENNKAVPVRSAGPRSVAKPI